MKKLSDLTVIEGWSEYICRQLATWSILSYVDCLRSEPIVVKELGRCSGAVKHSFLRACQGFLILFFNVLNTSPYSTYRLASLASVASPQTCSFKERKLTPLPYFVIWGPVCRLVVSCLLWKQRVPVTNLNLCWWICSGDISE